jgi:hypothetical protein
MTAIDLSSGLDPEVDAALGSPPADVWRFAENFLVAAYDPAAGIALWTHLGTWPDDFGLWEDQVLCALPGDEGMLWSFGYHRTRDDLRPAGAALRFRCIEPFRRWNASFDGVAVRTPYDEARAGRVRDGVKERLRFDLDIECVAPVWDPSAAHRDAMAEQSWASQHYQQLLRAAGTVEVAGTEVPFDGSGVRDHSRGQRGHANEHFGGHDLFCAAVPGGGDAFGMMRIWDEKGTVNFDAGYVFVDGRMHVAEVLDAPRLPADFRLRGDEVGVTLRSDLGTHEMRGTIEASTVTTVLPLGAAFGADASAGDLVFAQGFARWEWDGNVAHGLTERSDRFQ